MSDEKCYREKELADFEKKTEDLLSAVKGLQSSLDLNSAHTTAQAEDLKMLKEKLFIGNGQQSISSRLSMLTVKVDNLIDEFKSSASEHRKFKFAILGMAITIVGAIIKSHLVG